MSSKKLLIWLAGAAICAGLSTGAQAQWQWLDKDGRTVYSDRPPPADVPAQAIQKRGLSPGATGVSAPSGVAGSPADAARDRSNPAGGNAGGLAAMRQKASEAAANRQETERAANRKARAENCQRARQSLAMLDSGVRVTKPNAAGEREFLDDTQRAAERRQASNVLAQDCE